MASALACEAEVAVAIRIPGIFACAAAGGNLDARGREGFGTPAKRC